MHYCHTVALPGDLPADGEQINAALTQAMRPYDECYEGPYSQRREGQWDWWVIGGRWGGFWQLKAPFPETPLPSDDFSFGRRDRADEAGRTDCARLQDIAHESMTAPYSWLDLNLDWHTRWLGPQKAQTDDTSKWEIDREEWDAAYFAWIKTLPPQTWLVNVDYHS